MAEFDTTFCKSYGAKLQGNILIPERMLLDLGSVVKYLNKSYDCVMTLKTK